MEDARIQAISGALQISGGIILLLVRQPVFLYRLARTSVFALLSFGARWVGDFGLSQMLLDR